MSNNTIKDFREDRGSRFASPCHVFLGGLNNGGYGQLSKPVEKTRMVHLAAWRMVNGPVASGYQLDHRCRVRVCLNVGHLEVVTAAENIRRRAEPVARRRPLLVHTGPLVIGGTCRSGRHEVGPEDVAARACSGCRSLAMASSKDRSRRQSLAAQRGDWRTFRRLGGPVPPVPPVVWS